MIQKKKVIFFMCTARTPPCLLTMCQFLDDFSLVVTCVAFSSGLKSGAHCASDYKKGAGGGGGGGGD